MITSSAIRPHKALPADSIIFWRKISLLKKLSKLAHMQPPEIRLIERIAQPSQKPEGTSKVKSKTDTIKPIIPIRQVNVAIFLLFSFFIR